EPAAGLDPQARRDLSVLLLQLRDAGMTLVVSSHILAELEDYCSVMIIIDSGKVVGGKPIKVRDDERPRFMLELATARSDLRAFLVAQGIDVLEVADHHAVFPFTRNPSARAKLIRDLIRAGFDVSSFGESTRALEETYFAQVRKGGAA
ncbi:MAG TPA: hypothetical protein VN154_09365, partial [Rhizomicrobium sp.]|nr:hypothetical protein [Rhizomicrobium sp.]